MIRISLAALAACALVVLAAATRVHAEGTTGWRFAGAAELGAFEQQGMGGAAGFDLAYVHARERAVHSEYQFAYRRVYAGGMMTIPEEHLDVSPADLVALLAAVDLRAGARGHTSPFFRAGIGAGLAHCGAVRRGVLVGNGWQTSTTPAATTPGIAGRLAVGFGRLPTEGLGMEVSLGLLGFAAHGQSSFATGFALGLVH